jgi:RimJ/RimL family protein N-acetyltransferase
MEERSAAGVEYLALVTELLQRARRADPTGGVWEAADLQWWWRRDQHPDADRQRFWFDGDRVVAAVVLTDWGARVGCEVLAAGLDSEAVVDLVWPRLVGLLDQVGAVPVEMTIPQDDSVLIDAASAVGFRPTAEVGVETWMDAGDRPAVPDPPPGFALRARSDEPVRPHPMIPRNGEHVADRLAECSLYRPDLDLAIYDPAGDVAAYGLFWADPVTGVGLVEPMRTEDRHQRRGLGRCLLTAGLERLAGLGCTRLKVTYLVGNDASRRLYLGAGFTPGSSSRSYWREP